LGSYAVGEHLLAHPFQLSRFADRGCRQCGLPEIVTAPDPSELSDVREKHPGQIRHTDLRYLAFDLASFEALSSSAPSSDDWRVLVNILRIVRALPKASGLADLQKAIAGVVRSNKIERQALLEILGYVGVLCPPGLPSFQVRFVGYEERDALQPTHFFKREWAYPVQHWTGEVGIDLVAVAAWFGEEVAREADLEGKTGATKGLF
jgi:hypothetical protein